MSCHFCIMKNSGCAGCERNQLNHTGHIPLHYGLGSPITLSKNFLHEFILQLSTSLLADNNPSNPKIEESLKEGTLSKYCQCHLNTTIQSVTAKLSQTLGLQILQEVEKALEDEELTKENARKAAEKVFEEAVLAKAKVVAQEIAKTTAEEIMKVATASSTPRPVPETPRSTPAAPKKNIDQAAAVEIAKAQEAIGLGNPIAIAGSMDHTHKTIDDKFFQLELEFPVVLFEHSSQTAWVSDNGMFCLDEGSVSYADPLAYNLRNGQSLRNPSLPPYSLLPFWADLMILENKPHGIFHETVGQAGNRSLTVVWYVTRYGKETQYFHFSVLLQESQPNIATFKYYSIEDKGAECTVGVQGPRSQKMYSFNEKKIEPNLQIVFDTKANTMVSSRF